MGDWDWIEFASLALDTLLVYVVIYRVLLLIKGTKAVQMLLGLVGIGILFIVTENLNIPTFNWLLEQFLANILIIVIVVFQNDIRRALAAFGQTNLLSSKRSATDSQAIDELVKASTSMASQRIGALIVLERAADLSPYLADGTVVDAKLSKELLYSLFVPERQNPLHDGAVVIRGGRLSTAGVFLPMSVRGNIDRAYGTRHRAALGLSEEADAVAIVVSEERGSISVAVAGELTADVPAPRLREILTELMIQTPEPRNRFRRFGSLTRQAVTGERAIGKAGKTVEGESTS